MKPASALLTLCAIATVAGCGAWTHPQRSATAFFSDKMACEQRAAGQYPVQVVQRQASVGHYQPADPGCSTGSGHASCTTSPGTSVQPKHVPQDANAGNRSRAITDCLQTTGWTWRTN
jgi:hypothetical protein